MRRLLQWIVANPLAVILLVVVAAWGGTFALLRLPVGLFPRLDVPVVNVISHYPGASPQDMELLITRPIEGRVRAMPGVRRVASTSIEGISQVTAEFDSGTRLADARQLVQAALSAAQPDLPAGTAPRLESIGTTLQEVVGYVVYGGGSPVELRRAVQVELASRLMGVDGVSRVEVLGGDEPAFVVRLRPEALATAHLTVGDVADALARHNLAVPAGFIERGSREYLIRGDGRLRTIEDVGDVPVVEDGPRSVLLRDVATVRAGYAPRHYAVRGNGAPAVAFVVSKQPQASTTAVVRGVELALPELKGLLPPGAEVRQFYSQADIIAEARDGLSQDLVVGALLAAAVLLFFMGTFRATAIVAATIPLALLATLALMQAFGQTLNVITISALTLAVGMVVDDAIVVAESISRRLQEGGDRREAGVAGAAEIAGPDASGTFTTVAAFAPLLFIGGIAGLFVRPFGLVVSLALLASLVLSLTFVPAMLARASSQARPGGVSSALVARLDGLLQGILRFAFRHRDWVILLGISTLGLGALAAWLGPVGVLPPIDEGALLIEYVLPPGTSLTESDRVGGILERIALAEQDVGTVYRRTGSPERGFQIEGVNRGELVIKLAPRSSRRRTLAQVMDSLRVEYGGIPGVAYLYHQPTQEKMDESLSGLPAMFGVTIFGSDMDGLVALAGQVEQIMAGDGGLANIVNNTKIGSPQIVVRPRPADMARCGLEPADLFRTIQAARFGVEATSIVSRGQQIHVLVCTEIPSQPTLEWLVALPIATAGGEQVPLSQVADLSVSRVPSAVTRLNGHREVTVLAEVRGSIPAAVERLRRQFAAVRLPKGYSIAFTGQYEVMRRTVRDFALVGLGAVGLIYLIMAMQFRSLVQPLAVLLTIPVAFVGAIVLLAATRVGLDVSVGTGALTLIGIVVNNGIVLLAYANRGAAAGKGMAESLRAAVSVRLRPILMTAATTVFALAPVALSPSVGSRIFQPFAVTVIGGLLSSTAATLLLVPTIALALHRNRPGDQV